MLTLHSPIPLEEALKEHLTVVNSFKGNSPPMYLKFYLFNVKNADNVTAGTAKPVLEEV